jgi:hypothetical protein
MTGPTVVRPVHFHRQARGRKRLKDKAPEPVVVHGQRIPRPAQLLALAITFEDMIRTGEAKDYAEIARRTGVSRARICQITRLLELPPEIQEQLLSDQTGQGGRTS